MSRDPNRSVRLAVALLPKDARERYREQWAGELRDAAEVGIPTSQIANGALRFAAATPRPLPRWMRIAPPRLSVALALGAALVSLSDYATLSAFQDDYNFWQSAALGTTPLIVWVILVPVVAFVMAMLARSASRRERLIVALLAAASYLPFLRSPIGYFPQDSSFRWLTPSAIPFAGAAVLIVVAGILAWLEYGRRTVARPARRGIRMRRSAIAGLAVAVLVIACSIDSFARWASRTPPVWIEPVTAANRAEHAQWLELNALAEQLVSHVLVVWVVVGVVAALAVVAFGLSRYATLRRTIALASVVAAGVLVAYAGLILFLLLMTPTVIVLVPVQGVAVVARVALIVVVLFFLGRSGTMSPAPAAPSTPTVAA